MRHYTTRPHCRAYYRLYTIILLYYLYTKHIYAVCLFVSLCYYATQIFFLPERQCIDITRWTFQTQAHAYTYKNTDLPKSINCFIERGDGENFEKCSMCLGTLASAAFFIINLTNFIVKWWLALGKICLNNFRVLVPAYIQCSSTQCPETPQGSIRFSLKKASPNFKPLTNQSPRFEVHVQLRPIRHVGGTFPLIRLMNIDVMYSCLEHEIVNMAVGNGNSLCQLFARHERETALCIRCNMEIWQRAWGRGRAVSLTGLHK